MCGLIGFWQTEPASRRGAGRASPRAWPTRWRIAGRTTAASGSIRPPGSRSAFGACRSSISRPRATSRCSRRMGATCWYSTARSTTSRSCATRSSASSAVQRLARPFRHRGHARRASSTGASKRRSSASSACSRSRCGTRTRARLHLARDRMGEKPLYYGWMGGVLLFGSELKALCAHPQFRAATDQDAVALYMRYACVPAPYLDLLRRLQAAARDAVVDHDRRAACCNRGRKPRPYWSLSQTVTDATRNPFSRQRRRGRAGARRLLRELGRGLRWSPMCRSARSCPAASTLRRWSR